MSKFHIPQAVSIRAEGLWHGQKTSPHSLPHARSGWESVLARANIICAELSNARSQSWADRLFHIDSCSWGPFSETEVNSPVDRGLGQPTMAFGK
jgi:hypothetical protein